MAETLPIPPFPAVEVRPSRAHLERGAAVFRAELEAASDRSGQAILAHHLGRLFGRQQDFAAAAREELEATNLAAGFAAPLEALWAIAVRGRSRKNAETLLDRLLHIAKTGAERERAGLTLAAQYLDDRRHADARRVLEACLEGAPGSVPGWLLLEEVAHRELDFPLARRALTGRASAASNDELESLLYERAARVELELGALDEADALIDQALVTYPRWETFLRRERMFSRAGRSDRAAVAALASIEHLESTLEGLGSGQAPLPPMVRSRAEVDGIRLRAALLWVEAGDHERALEQARLVAATEGAGLFERALHATLAERGHNLEERALALARASDALDPADTDSRAALALWRWSALAEEGPLASAAGAEALPESPGLLGILLENAERAADARSLPDLLGRITNLTPRAKAEERTNLLLSATWIALAGGQKDEARRFLALASSEGIDADLQVAIELGLSRQAGDAAGELAALERLTKISEDTPERELFAWLALRRALLGSPNGDGERQGPSVRAALAALVEASKDSRASRLAAWLWSPEATPSPSGDGRAFDSEEMLRAETIVGLLLHHSEPASWYERAEVAHRAAPTDPLLAGLAVRAAEDAGAPSADRVALLQRFAALVKGPSLAQAARLRALLLLLKDRAGTSTEPTAPQAAQGQLATLLLALSHEAELAPLWLWLLRSHKLVIPEALSPIAARLLGQEPWLQLESALRHLATSAAPPADLMEAPLSTAGSLLQMLTAVASGEPTAADILDDAPNLDDQTLGGLLLGAASHGASPEGRLAAARRFHQLAPDTDSLLAYAVAARQNGQGNEEARARRALAEQLGAPELLASAQLGTRNGDLDEERARRILGLATGTDRREQAAIAWELCEVAGSLAGPRVRGEALQLLAESIPDEVDGPLARLLAGYQAIIAGLDDEAISLLAPLVDLLPDDSSVHIGLCAAALRAGRADIEAASSTELARRETDAAEAARRWERAGVLFQDQLGAPEQAEAAFQSAMGRVPGSPLSFVRLYQLAHAKRDRPRMVELIDARLEAPADEHKRIALLWEKARHCRQLGRRGAACRALEDLLELSSDHLQALALLAELHLLDQRLERAAPLLRQVALHPLTPAAQRESAGLHAVDLLERLAMASEAMDLLVALEQRGVPVPRMRRRKARLAARVGRWDIAAATFRELAEEDDDIPTRLEAARLLLAIERDHLRESANLKDAARLVLRDAPTDPDAAAIVVQENFHPDERARLLGPVREATLGLLRERPLDLPIIGRMTDFSEGTDNVREERAWLGALALTGRLSDTRSQRLEALTSSARTLPSGNLSQQDLEFIVAPGQLGTMAQVSELVIPKIAKITLPDREALGLRESMRVDPFGPDGIGAEVLAWSAALGVAEPQIFVGGIPAGTTLLLPGEVPTLVLGSGMAAPLTSATRARLGFLLFGNALGVAPLLVLGLAEAKTWLAAVLRLTGRAMPEKEPDEVEERARQLARLFTSDERAELSLHAQEIEKGDRSVTDLALTSLTSAARMATVIHGDPSILRQLRELIPDVEQERSALVGEVIQLLASPQLPTFRTKLGLDLT
jgi:hypothetical protein